MYAAGKSSYRSVGLYLTRYAIASPLRKNLMAPTSVCPGLSFGAPRIAQAKAGEGMVRLTDLDQLVIERACERLAIDYCHFTDHGEASRVADLFTDDGVWVAGDTVMSGRARILRGFQHRENNAARMSRHVCSTMQIDVHDADNASGCVYLTLYRHDGDPERKLSPLNGPAMVGEYRDAFRRTPDGWRIARRELFIAFMADEVLLAR
jgi:ketosteroid isomerase-like protein